jgi:hypothetical protein
MSRYCKVAALLLVVLAGSALAQSFLGSIGGTALDPTGAVVPNANVKVTEVGTGIARQATTNNEGRYLFADLPRGTYVVAVSATGFKEARSSPIILTAQQNSRFDATLEVGAGSQSIEVMATPPTINTEDAQINEILTRQELVNLPLDRRSTISFMYLNSANYDTGGGISLGGLRESYTNFTVDGITANTSLWGGQSSPLLEESFEAIAEQKMSPSNNSAEYPNVGTVIIATRSGTNQPHGSLFLTTANNALNARAYFADSKPKGPQRHEYGGSFGGPLILPKIYDGRNKTFFYFTWEHNTFPEGGSTYYGEAGTPTLKMRAGDFSQLLPGTVVTDPTTGKPFDGNKIPTDRLSQVALKFQDFGFPLPNTGAENNFVTNWRGAFPSPEHVNREVVRFDHQLGSRDALSSRASIFGDPMPAQYSSAFPVFKYHQFRNARNVYASETHTFSPRIVNEFRVGFSRDYSFLAAFQKGWDVVKQVGLQGVIANGDLYGVPDLTFVNFPEMASRPDYRYLSQSWEALNNISVQKGKHGLKAGILVRYAQPGTTPWSSADFGQMNFSGFATGFDYADFLLGIPRDSERVYRAPTRYNRYTNTGAFVQDNFSVTPKLTLNLGLRWDYFMPPVDKNDLRYAFDPATGNLVVPSQKALQTWLAPGFPSSIPIVTAQQAGFPGRSMLNGDHRDFSPRVGFAYRVKEHTVIRGGYGLYYAPLSYTNMDPFVGGPFQSDERFYNQITNGVPLLQFPNPFTGTADVGSQSVAGVDKSLPTPRTQQWNLTVERDLGRSMVARVSYRGFISTHIPFVVNLNTPPASADPNNVNNYRYPNFSRVDFTMNGGIGKMNGLDLALERKFANGVTFQAGYTLAKNISDVGNSSENATIEDPYNRQREMADVANMPRQRFVSEVLYEIPFGRGQRFGGNLPRVVSGMFGNWQLSAVCVKQTGSFVDITYEGDSPNVRGSSLRPDLVGDWHVSNPTRFLWFNPQAFQVPAPGQYGNSPRNVVVGPGLTNFNLGIHKFFNLTEKARLQLQARAANAFNHPNFGLPSADISAAGAGTITSLQGDRYDSFGAGTRVIRVGFRLDF